MNEADGLAALFDRVAAAGGETAMFSERELAEWPVALLAGLKAAGLLVKGPPADVVSCPGCEEDCAMPVEAAITAGGKWRAFVVCDRRDDVSRVAVAPDLLEQWICSPDRVADTLARLLGIRRSDGDAAGGRWDVGVLKGTQHSAHVVLGIDRVLRLAIAGHSLPVADVLEFSDKGLILERRALLRCVDNPVAAAGDTPSRDLRIERLRKRRNELRSAGVHNFNQVLAREENCSVSLIKQLLAEKKPANKWLDPTPASKGAVSKNPKTRY